MFTWGLSHMYMTVTLSKLKLNSSLKTTWFHSVAVQYFEHDTTQNSGYYEWVSLVAHVKGAAIVKVSAHGMNKYL